MGTSVIRCTLQWRHKERNGVWNHRRFHCLLNCWFRRRSKKTSKLRTTGLCEGYSPVTDEFPHKRPIARKMFPFDDVIMRYAVLCVPRPYNWQKHWKGRSGGNEKIICHHWSKYDLSMRQTPVDPVTIDLSLQGLFPLPLRPSDAIWRHWYGSTLAESMVWCRQAASHCLS